MTKQQQCPKCEGTGQIPLGEHFVTREMALDGGDPQLEGMSMGIEYGACSNCSGDGWLIEELEKP